MYYVYILECRDGSFYVGQTNCFDRRFTEHLTGKGGHFTRSFRPECLLYIDFFPTRSLALAEERRLKSLSRKQKERLVNAGGFGVKSGDT